MHFCSPLRYKCRRICFRIFFRGIPQKSRVIFSWIETDLALGCCKMYLHALEILWWYKWTLYLSLITQDVRTGLFQSHNETKVLNMGPLHVCICNSLPVFAICPRLYSLGINYFMRFQGQVCLRLQLTKQLRVRFDELCLVFWYNTHAAKILFKLYFPSEVDIESCCCFVYML